MRFIPKTPNMNVIGSLQRLTMLEKALNRLERQNFFDKKQSHIVETAIDAVLQTRMFIERYKVFGNVRIFMNILAIALADLGACVITLIASCPYNNGKKQIRKSHKYAECKKLMHSINEMVNKLKVQFSNDKNDNSDRQLREQFSNFIAFEFERWLKEYKQKLALIGLSGRGKQTCIYPFSDVEVYIANVSNNEWFKKEMMKDLNKYIPEASHCKHCLKANRVYRLKGFRPKSRKVIFYGKKQEIKVRIVQCIQCEKNFSVLPSFVPREKHYAIDIIGALLEGILLRGVCLNYAKTITALTGFPIKSKQTVLNWLKWIGNFHPAEILERTDVKKGRYLQEDEGFQKEPNLRTYIATMVEPNVQLVWHIDYLDDVGEDSLYESFEDFSKKISFNIIGVTKDKWKPSTKALKRVFKGVWIGYCHRHCLKKFNEALAAYQKETGIKDEKPKELYNIFRGLLEATHGSNLIAKIKGIKDKAFEHPLLKSRLDELEQNAVHYTANKHKAGIKKTTSIVDNFLKLAKRKLREAMSFRDPKWADIFFKAMANVRNFLPFQSGAKNAHKSPFMLAGGDTFSLSWMQVINVYNGFLFI